MSCCAQRQGHSADRSDRRRISDIAAFANATPPERITFRGGKSHVGTSRPEIRSDGEGLVSEMKLRPFAADAMPVTNARFAAFVAATGHVTEAEHFGWGPVFRGLLSDPVADLRSQPRIPWWVTCYGAWWAEPEGPGSHVRDRADHPVTHISWADASAFAAWSVGRLPTEAEWEHAARGGLEGDPRFPWGDREPDDTDFLPCNIWQGRFPAENTCADGFLGTSPVGAFAPNAAGLYDMAGNVWEWTSEPFVIRSASRAARLRNAEARAANQKIMKGGSFLCHISYCYRYRIAARSGTSADSGSSNTGLRVFYGL
jgi:formylglycine-generating enzyme required for sulfatase activity